MGRRRDKEAGRGHVVERWHWPWWRRRPTTRLTGGGRRREEERAIVR